MIHMWSEEYHIFGQAHMKTCLHVSMGISNICCFANVEAQCYPFLKHYPQDTILLGHSMMERPPKRFLLKLPLHPF